MAEGMDKAREEFFSEAQELVESLSRNLLALDTVVRSGSQDPALVNEAFRAVHTLKGLAGLFGAKRVSTLSHRLEDVLDSLRLGRIALTPEVLDLLFRAVEAYGVSLTAAGKAALLHLRVAHQELEASLTAAAKPGTLDLRIGALPLTLVRPLPYALARLRKRVPHVHVHLTEDTVPNLWRQIEAGQCDAIVCRLPELSEQPRLPPGVAHKTVGHDTLVLVCARSHPVAKRRKPSLPRLQEYDWVLPPEGSYTRLSIERLFLRAGLRTPAPVITSMSFHANLRLAAEGSVLGVLVEADQIARWRL